MQNKEILKYLRLNESSVVMNSESSDADNFDFQVTKGYFSSTEDDNLIQNKKGEGFQEEKNLSGTFLL